MKHRLRVLMLRGLRRLQLFLTPKPDPIPQLQQENQSLKRLLERLVEENAVRSARSNFARMVSELAEAAQMRGVGPWTISPETAAMTDRLVTAAAEAQNAREGMTLREALGDAAIGASGDINLMLQNIQWKRDIHLSWLEFSRWGIQQIILITRLYYLKKPIIRRLIDVCAAYVFARGVEVTSSDETANRVLQDFFARNKAVLGQNALIEHEKRKDYDGNLFFAFFTDKSTGDTDVRLIDATEIQEIVTNPDDAGEPWYYRRSWSQRNFSPESGVTVETKNAWYPALNYTPDDKPAAIQGNPIMWDVPVYHRKCGAVGQWLFGCPRMYPALDWARAAEEYLQDCASLNKALSQIGLVITTKGGQQAIEGAKAQLSTTVGPNTNIWDVNPPAVPGATFASGTGTDLKAMNLTGAGMDPEKVRQYKLQPAMVSGVPETFLADVSTGNLATATSLDRPTETIFLEKQESWREDLVTIATYVLQQAKVRPSGRLSESHGFGKDVRILECRRHIGPRGEVVYEAFQPESAGVIEVKVNFPAIREGDLKDLVSATVEAMTLNNKGGEVVGIDEKAGVLKLCDLLGIEDGAEIVEEQYPNGKYVRDRSEEEIPPPIEPLKAKGGEPQINPQTGEENNMPPVPQREAALPARDPGGRPAAARINSALRRVHEATSEYAGTSK